MKCKFFCDDLIKVINSQNFTLFTFDKDFLDDNFSVSQGIYHNKCKSKSR